MKNRLNPSQEKVILLQDKMLFWLFSHSVFITNWNSYLLSYIRYNITNINVCNRDQTKAMLSNFILSFLEMSNIFIIAIKGIMNKIFTFIGKWNLH